MNIGKNLKTLSNAAPIIVTWVPKDIGKTLPDGKNSKLNYVDVLIKHKQGTNEERDIFLIINGPGFKSGQIEELKDKFKGVDGIHVIDLHDPKYDSCWKELDQEWKISGKDISIQDYFHDMYSKEPQERTHFTIEIDTLYVKNKEKGVFKAADHRLEQFCTCVFLVHESIILI